MTILKFRSRRQRDPFAGHQTRHTASHASGFPPAGSPVPAPAATPAYATRIDPAATLAGLVRQAEAGARPPWVPAREPLPGPDLLADEAHAFYGWDITKMDVPPRHDRPYIPGVLGAEGRLTPRHAGVSDDLGSLPLFRDAVRRISRPACEQCQQATGTWQERLYGTFLHHTRPVDGAGPRQFGIATELRQAHGETAADADDAEAAFARRYLMGRAA